MGMSSWQLIAATCVWLGSALTVWTVAPAKPTSITIQTIEIPKEKKESKVDGSIGVDADDSPSNHTESSTDSSSSDESEVESENVKKGDDDAV